MKDLFCRGGRVPSESEIDESLLDEHGNLVLSQEEFYLYDYIVQSPGDIMSKPKQLKFKGHNIIVR